MRIGGNNKFNDFLKEHNVSKTMDIVVKYNTPAALFYRERLHAEANGLPLPTKMPEAAAVIHGSDPLPGEDEAQYVARQRLLQEQARERMRQKFGASSGLSSSGRMQGIGSDPNYGASSTKSGEWDVNQALSVFATNLTAWGETVSKKTSQLLDTTNNPTTNTTNNPNNSSSSEDNGDLNEQLVSAWSSLTIGAATIWKQAITQIQLDDPAQEEDYRFPRPPGATTTSNNTSNKSSTNGNNGIGSAPVSVSSHASWDSLSDVLPINNNNNNSNTNSSASPIRLTSHTPANTSAKKDTNKDKDSSEDDFFASFGV